MQILSLKKVVVRLNYMEVFIMVKNKLRWLVLKVRWYQWRMKVAKGVSDATMAAYERYYHVPGSEIMGNLSIVFASKVYKLECNVVEYEDEMEDLTLPISEAERLFNRSPHADYVAMEHKQFPVLIMHMQFRTPKAQLMRMLEGKQ
jgi:hypothetical protein